MKKLALLILFINFVYCLNAQNVGINSTGVAPAASAMLDIVSTTQGLLVPRVALSDITVAAPVTSPAVSLIVYNTFTSALATPSNNVLPGFYYWDGVKWVAFSGSGGKDWSLTGNGGTTPPSVGYGTTVNNNFLGTTDAQDLVFATNNLERMRIKTDNSSQLRIGMGTAFTVNLNTGSTPSLLHIHDWGTTSNDFAILNLSSQTTASGDRTGVINFAATSATNERRAASIESYLTAASGTNVSGDLRFFTNNANSYTEKMRIIASGVVGIGTNAPSTSGGGASPVDKFNVTSSTTVGGGDMVDISNTSANGLNTYVVNTNSGNSYNALAGETRFNANTGTPSGVYGAVNATTGTAFGVTGVSGSNAGIGVYAQVPSSNSNGIYAIYAYGRVITTGNYFITSDARLKKNIAPVSNALSKVLKLRAVEYDFDEKYEDFVGSDERQTGFLAQEVEKVIPNIVSSASLISKLSNTLANEAQERKRMDAKVVTYSGLIPYLVEAIKEQQQQIEGLKSELEKLKKDK